MPEPIAIDDHRAVDHHTAAETADNYRWVVLAVTSMGALLAVVSSMRGVSDVEEGLGQPIAA